MNLQDITPFLGPGVSAAGAIISVWAATRSISAKNAGRQLEILEEKLKHERRLEVVTEARFARDQTAVVELIMYNLNSHNIYISGALLNGNTPLDLENMTSKLISPTLKPAEGTAVMQFVDFARVSGNHKNHLDINVDGFIEYYIYLSSDPGYIHTHIVGFKDRRFTNNGGRRITSEEFEAFLASIA